MVFPMRLRIAMASCPWVLLWVALLGAGCRESGGEKTYDVRGIVRELRVAEKEVVVRHEEIPGYMAAMTMPFPVRSMAELAGLKVGDQVAFRLHVTATNSHSDAFVVVSNAPAAVPPGVVLNDTNAFSLYADVPELKRGDTLPDYAFTNQFGNAFHLREYRGKVLVFNFIFTRCPLPDFCPRASSGIADTMRLLKSRPSVPGNWRMLSLSFDPVADTPEVLKQYGERFGCDPAYWTIGTGAFDQLQPLGSHFGLYFARNVTPDNQNHNLRTVVVDAQGRVSDILVGKDWTPEMLADSVVRALSAKP